MEPQRSKIDAAPPNLADCAGSALVVIVMTRTVRDGPARPYACNLPEACDRLTPHSTQRTTAVGMGDYAHGHVSATNDNNGRDTRTGESTVRRAFIKIVQDARDGARAVTAPLSMYDGERAGCRCACLSTIAVAEVPRASKSPHCRVS